MLLIVKKPRAPPYDDQPSRKIEYLLSRPLTIMAKPLKDFVMFVMLPSFLYAVNPLKCEWDRKFGIENNPELLTSREAEPQEGDMPVVTHLACTFSTPGLWCLHYSLFVYRFESSETNIRGCQTTIVLPVQSRRELAMLQIILMDRCLKLQMTSRMARARVAEGGAPFSKNSLNGCVQAVRTAGKDPKYG